MKKILLSAIVGLLVLSFPAWAFLYEIKILTGQEIEALSNQELSDIYTEAKIEEKTSAEFHVSAGFSSAKEYNKRKDLLRFIIHLRREMQKRNVEIEPIDEWMK